ncbi:MAG TPA: MFS transporter, partial [Burkholderiaceae bacterium]|nr:MFS transporter [Burkholderiaceae bacterium]
MSGGAPAFAAGAAPGALVLFARVFLPFGTGYFLSFLYRSINAVIFPELMRDTGVGASGLGLLTAAFFIGFATVQLPLGLMLDRYGAARVQAALLTVAAIGALAFASATTPAGLVVARALIGHGCAGGLMAAFKAIVIVALVLLQSDKALQPGGRNWLWQTQEVKGLDDALNRSTLADFLDALGAS